MLLTLTLSCCTFSKLAEKKLNFVVNILFLHWSIIKGNSKLLSPCIVSLWRFFAEFVLYLCQFQTKFPRHSTMPFWNYQWSLLNFVPSFLRCFTLSWIIAPSCTHKYFFCIDRHQRWLLQLLVIFFQRQHAFRLKQLIIYISICMKSIMYNFPLFNKHQSQILICIDEPFYMPWIH